MKKIFISFALVLVLTTAFLYAGKTVKEENLSQEKIDVVRVGDLPTREGPKTSFTGKVSVEYLFPGGHSSKISGGIVSFEPGARTAWHTHPKGQTIVIQSGIGWVQQWGGEIIEVRPGDVVWFPPNVKHWHGASPANAMSHLSFAEIYEGRSTDWLEKVTDKQYKK